MPKRIGDGGDLSNVALRWKGASESGNRLIDVDAAQLMQSACKRIVRHEAKVVGQFALDAQRRLHDIGHLEIGLPLNHARWKRKSSATRKRIRIARIAHDQISLILSVDAQNLFERRIAKPIIKNPASAAN